MQFEACFLLLQACHSVSLRPANWPRPVTSFELPARQASGAPAAFKAFQQLACKESKCRLQEGHRFGRSHEGCRQGPGEETCRPGVSPSLLLQRQRLQRERRRLELQGQDQREGQGVKLSLSFYLVDSRLLRGSKIFYIASLGYQWPGKGSERRLALDSM